MICIFFSRKKSELDEHDSFLVFTRYDDLSTFSLVDAVSDTLGVPVEKVLEIFGEFFFDYCLRHGYDKMLRTLGSDMKSFIQNLDSLHSLLALSYKGISAPSFRCEDGPDGELILHYYSGRPGLYPIVKGVLKAVARDLFEQSVEMTVIEQNLEDIGCNQTQEHTAFSLKTLTEFHPDKVLLKASEFCSAFPYHIIFDRELRIKQCGDLVQKHSSFTLTDGMLLTSAFSIVHPKMVVSIENIRKFINAVFLLAICQNDNGKKTFLLKGQMIWLRESEHMIFIGSPRLTSLNELLEMNVYLADIPLYDVTRELVLLNQQRIAEIDIAKRLDETTAELKKISQALEVEKSKTESLLHQMLPRNVANALTNGKKVEAEKFDQVTVLFSDIVTFTNIASACNPMDIVNLLNDMYQRFDERTSQHNVYKVETIGDAYMIVSGVPEKTDNHAQPVANFALDMIEDAGLVRSPATGLPLQIRVGIHTGPVVAGVVGVKMPRYCLFGDTVNTASRMESHGVPGRIHLSPTTYQALRGWGYIFKHRGEMEIKGKGMMSTYFLCGHLNRCLTEPQDEFTELEVHRDTAAKTSCLDNSSLSHEILSNETILADTTSCASNVSKFLYTYNNADTDNDTYSKGYEKVTSHHLNSISESNDASKSTENHNTCSSSDSLPSLDNYQRRVSIKRSNLWLPNDNPILPCNVPFLDSNCKPAGNMEEVASSLSRPQERQIPHTEHCVVNDDFTQSEDGESSCYRSQRVLIPCALTVGEINRPHNLTLHNKHCPKTDTSTEICDLTVETTNIRPSGSHSRNSQNTLDIQILHSGLIHTSLTVTPTLPQSSHHCVAMSKSETFPLASSGQPKSTCTPSRSQGTLALRKDPTGKKAKKHNSKLCTVG
ncbi:unnamed protein product [Candidula unifasciata]|uniref:guanylate cyclase n=1 Tax=Candidula unifasciata TaxID=100452 RepID=A0A8S3ZHN4_9EUPU|nr:unnamed protein product [Candidula unifasciata]